MLSRFILFITIINYDMFFDSSSESYRGGWINGMKHGNGISRFKDSSIYEVILLKLQSYK